MLTVSIFYNIIKTNKHITFYITDKSTNRSQSNFMHNDKNLVERLKTEKHTKS